MIFGMVTRRDGYGSICGEEGKEREGDDERESDERGEVERKREVGEKREQWIGSRGI